MTMRNEILEGLNSFVAMRNAFKQNPYEDYMQWKMENDPDYKSHKEARERVKQETGIDVNKIKTPTSSYTPGQINTTALPPPTPQPPPQTDQTQLAWGGAVPAVPYSGAVPNIRRGGVIPHYQGGDEVALLNPDEPGISPVERMRRLAWIRQQSPAPPNPGETGGQPVVQQPTPYPVDDPLRRAVPPPPDEPLWSPQGDIVRQNTIDEVRRRRAEAERQAIATGTTAAETATPPRGAVTPPAPQVDQPQPLSPREQRQIEAQRAGVEEEARMQREGRGSTPDMSPEAIQTRADAAKYAQGPDEAAMQPPARTSKIERALQGPRDAAVNELRRKQIQDLLRERSELEPGLTQQTSPEERAAIEAKQSAIDQQIARLQGAVPEVQPAARPAAPGQQGTPTPVPAQTSPQTPPVPVPMDQRGPRVPAPTPPVALRVKPPVPVNQPQPLLPPPGTPLMPQAATAREAAATPAAAPPAGPAQPGTGGGGATPAPAPATTPPGVVPSGSVGDQRRVTAFDPTRETSNYIRVDPATGQVTRLDPNAITIQRTASTQGYGPDHNAAQASLDKALMGGANYAQYLTHGGDGTKQQRDSHALYAGVGAMDVPTSRGIVSAWNNGGQLNPSQAMMRYMVYKYESLVAQGQSAKADQMAFEVMQRANLEAAKYGNQAVQYVQQGNMPAAMKSLQVAHGWTPDHTELAFTKDGKSFVLRNEYTGQPLHPPMRVTPQSILAAALGLGDGTAFWNHLANRVQYARAQKDKNAEGRAIINENNRMRGELLRRKLQGGGKGGAVGYNEAEQRARDLIYGPPRASAQPRAQGSDDTDLAQDTPLPNEETANG